MKEKVKIAINGFGRIGRLSFRELLKKDEAEIVAINDLTDIETLAHLLRYDSVHGKLDYSVQVESDFLVVNGMRVKVVSNPTPETLPWADLKVDVVIECTGRFLTQESASQHIKAGASKVVLSAPAKDAVKTIVIGVNDQTLTKEDVIVSNASCTTNCLAPIVKVLDENFGIEKGYISTVHAYTADQNLQDAPHKDLRRARAAALSIIPTTTGAASAVAKVLPSMLTDLTAILNKDVTKEQINEAFEKASKNELKGVLEYTSDPLVSVDIVGNTHSCIVDSQLTAANGSLVKIVGWYDNEYGYASRLAELTLKMAML